MRPVADDPLKELLSELMRAHDRLQAGEQPAAAGRARGVVTALRSAWRHRRRRTAAALSAGVLVLSASAAAAVVVVVASQPLTGRLPRELLGTRYALRAAPDLRAGHVGWCISLLDIGANETVQPVPDACVSGRGPLIASGGIAVISPKTGRTRAWILYGIVDRSIATLQTPDGARIRAIRSRELPSSWRAAVTITAHPVADGGRSTAIELAPAGAARGRLSARAALPAVLPTHAVSASSPAPAGCRLRIRTWAGISVGARRAIATPPHPIPGAAGYLACYSANIDLGGSVSVVALLLDAAHPDSRAPVLPGFRPLRGHAGVWEGPASASGGPDTGLLERFFAQRVGNGWLVLQTPASATMALALLDRVTSA